MISAQFKQNLPSGESNIIDLHIGETVRVSYNIVEGGKTRVQTFEGLLIAWTW